MEGERVAKLLVSVSHLLATDPLGFILFVHEYGEFSASECWRR